MSYNQRWILGDDTNEEKNDPDIGINKPLLQPNEFPKKTPFLRMLFFGSIISAPYTLAGMSLSFSSIALPQMDVNIDEASWFGSLQFFGSMFGALTMGLIMDKYGRRPSFLLCIISCIIGWTLLATSTNIYFMYLGQFLAAIISGCLYIGQIYAAESIVINHCHLRNSFNIWASVANMAGVILDSVLGRLFPYQTVALIAAIMAVTSLLGICIFIPESPHWLYHRGLIHRARWSEKKLSIHQPVLENFDHTQARNKFDMTVSWQSIKESLQKLKRKDVYKPLIMMNVWSIFIVFAGSACVSAYQVSIINGYPLNTHPSKPWSHGFIHNKISISYDITIISSILALVAIIMTSILVTYTGVKILFSFSATGLALGMTGLAVCLGIKEEYQLTEFWQSAHTTSIWLVVFFDTLGVTSILISLVGEMLPHDAKGFSSLPALSYNGIGGIVIKMHPYFFRCFGYLLYLFYAFCSLLTIIFVVIFVPETVGKTQEEIEEHFAK